MEGGKSQRARDGDPVIMFVCQYGTDLSKAGKDVMETVPGMKASMVLICPMLLTLVRYAVSAKYRYTGCKDSDNHNEWFAYIHQMLPLMRLLFMVLQVEYQWESLDGWDAIPKKYSSNNLVVLAPIPAEAGKTYRVQLTARFAGATKAATKVVELLAVGAPLEASLKWAGGEVVKADQLIILDATGSKDPDDPNGKQPLTYLWECVREDFPTPCFSTLDRGVQRAGKWTFSARLLDPNIEHTFRVTVVKGGRSATATNPIKITAKAAQVPTGRIVRLCSGAGDTQACPTLHNADSPLSLALYLDPSSSAATYSWSSDQIPSISGRTGTSLAIPVDKLPRSGVLVVSVQLLLEGVEGRTSLSIPINAPPRCVPAVEGEKCLKVEVKSANYPKAVFEATASGFVEDDQLR